MRDGENFVAGDNASATLDAAGQLRTFTTTSPANGGRDVITSGVDNDVVFGVYDQDRITIADGNNVVLGDNAQAILTTLD